MCQAPSVLDTKVDHLWHQLQQPFLNSACRARACMSSTQAVLLYLAALGTSEQKLNCSSIVSMPILGTQTAPKQKRGLVLKLIKYGTRWKRGSLVLFAPR